MNLPEVTVDRLSVTGVFGNLVEDALRYGSEHLSEIMTEHTKTPDYHVFLVSDNGVGLKPDVCPDELFKRSYRHKTSRGTE